MCRAVVLLLLVLELSSSRSLAQAPTPPLSVPSAVEPSPLLDAFRPSRREAFQAIYLIVCPSISAGSGFLLQNGVMVTNSHVIADCDAQSLAAIGFASRLIKFKAIIRDTSRDLALLIPVEAPQSKLTTSSKTHIDRGESVWAFGYQLVRGKAYSSFIGGLISDVYDKNSENKGIMTRILVTAAFNLGAFDAPLFLDAESTKVVGIMVSDEIYRNRQVVTGEAIPSGELDAMLVEHAAELK
jgi:S1-C subfamily serine protease